MTTTTIHADTESTMVIELDGLRLAYSNKTDSRVIDVEDGKVLCADEQAAGELEREMQAWGAKAARALGCAVVFWS